MILNDQTLLQQWKQNTEPHDFIIIIITRMIKPQLINLPVDKNKSVNVRLSGFVNFLKWWSNIDITYSIAHEHCHLNVIILTYCRKGSSDYQSLYLFLFYKYVSLSSSLSSSDFIFFQQHVRYTITDREMSSTLWTN